ncbi:MAG: APC family permease, partial [Gammaproteobacteria bacterium]|nr:APC family permease [Gammaproteobacteria bacterium]NNL49563.1 APC family permease [Woeseiaceae bacterium]
GIFALPGVAAEAAGLFSPWLFVICAVLIMTVVLSFARAASFFGDTGGPIVYVEEAFGNFAGFQAGWLYTFARIAALAANAHLMVTYAAWLWPALDAGVPRLSMISFVCVFLTFVNVIGVRGGMATIFAMTVLKLLPLSLIALVGLVHINPDVFVAPQIPEIEGIGGLILVLLYAFVGFEAAVVPAGEVKSPQKSVPRSLIWTVAVISVLYFVIQLVSVSVVPDLGSTGRPLAAVAEALLGAPGATLLVLGAVFSILGNISSMFITGPRMLYAMGRDGGLPSWFAVINTRFHTPVNSIVFMGVVGLALALSGGFVWLAAMSTVVRLIIYMATILALPRLKKNIGEQPGQFSLPGGMLIPVIALLLCLWLTMHASIKSWLTMLVFAAIGTVMYFLTRRFSGKSPESNQPLTNGP